MESLKCDRRYHSTVDAYRNRISQLADVAEDSEMNIFRLVRGLLRGDPRVYKLLDEAKI